MNLTKAKETKTRVCCLYRVSTKGQVDKAENDIPMQKKACHEFAESKGWTIIKEHAELGVSGFKVAAADRDELQEIKREAEKQEFDILLVFMFDRLTVMWTICSTTSDSGRRPVNRRKLPSASKLG